MADETTKVPWHGGVCSVEIDTDLAIAYYSLENIERNALDGIGLIDSNVVVALAYMRRYLDKLAKEKME